MQLSHSLHTIKEIKFQTSIEVSHLLYLFEDT